ncbi:MAG: ribosome maturation factor RimP [Pyramidobacter sp.]|uniref:ribosome maturation factor RimP n=1 Tax=unclassified Pyramidobacter TaxID=2632171 RepID=UPI00098EC5ED|nr:MULTISPECIES: ribosome maturation factor RimP [unclassified Pyramidobacter]MDY4031576.1 ribosome maturation factor RimP [Pyramidobacter sp.]
MDMEKISEQLKAFVESLGYEFVGAETVKEAGSQILRVYIDRDGGVGLDDCERCAKDISALLDTAADVFEDHYLLEVSSPGLERPLFKAEDYARFAGRSVSIRLRDVYEGRRRVTAVIEGIKDGAVLLDCGGEPLDLPLAKIQKAHLVYEEEKGQKKTFKKRGGKS